MRFVALIFAALAVISPAPAVAEGETLGVGRLFTNDYLGDRSDRWRTGSYVASYLRGTAQDFLELRFQSQIISPDGRQDDRPYAGVLTGGAAFHQIDGPLHVMVGADVVVIGPQTGLAAFQEDFHDRFDMPPPFTARQLDDQRALSLRASATVTQAISDRFSIRPFVAGRTGVEDVVRVGADLLFGPVGQGDIWLRDDVTGQPYRGTQTGPVGLSYSIGADIGAVGGSIFLPDDGGAVPIEQRHRARAGVHWQASEETSLFYGLTYLSEEFEGQSAGQVVGSLTLNFSF